MINSRDRDEKIVELKEKLAKTYVWMMTFLLLVIAIYCWLFLKNNFVGYYMLFGSITISVLWLFFKDKFEIHKIVKIYLIFGPLYNILMMFLFWTNSIVSFVWLIPVPLIAYIFFSKKYIFYYSIYSVVLIVIVSIFAKNFSTYNLKLPLFIIRVGDLLLLLSNIAIITHLLIFNDKIRKLQAVAEYKEREKIDVLNSFDSKEIKQYSDLFDRIDDLMKTEQIFKDPNFNISSLCTTLNVSTSYISRAIRYKEYPNFNSYINKLRIDYVVDLLNTTDLEKVTLLYIYTEAGYKSQSTFNRVFKEIKGVTPSEFIQKMKIVEHEK